MSCYLYCLKCKLRGMRGDISQYGLFTCRQNCKVDSYSVDEAGNKSEVT